MKLFLKSIAAVLAASVVTLILLGLVCMAGFAVFYVVTAKQAIKQLLELDSPSGDYTLILELHSGPPTVADSVIGKVRNNKTGRKKTIYSVYRERKANAIWINEDEVEINGIRLNIYQDDYSAEQEYYSGEVQVD